MNPILRKLRVTRVTRLRLYLEKLERGVPIKRKAEKENIQFLKESMNSAILKMGVFAGARAFFYVLLYASVVINFLGDLADPTTTAFINRFASPIIVLSSILGTTISVTYILIFSKFVNTYWEDVRTYSTSIIAIYAKYDTKGKGYEEHKLEID